MYLHLSYIKLYQINQMFGLGLGTCTYSAVDTPQSIYSIIWAGAF